MVAHFMPEISRLKQAAADVSLFPLWKTRFSANDDQDFGDEVVASAGGFG